MSKPKRYIFRIRECGCVKPEHLEGKYAPPALIIEETEEKCGWVRYEDYARLKAEVERLTAFTTRTIIPNEQLQAQVERLTTLVESNLNQSKLAMAKSDASVRTLEAQVKRLTKAGDAFYESEIGYYGEQILNDPKHHSGQMCRDWNAAKEGKPRA